MNHGVVGELFSLFPAGTVSSLTVIAGAFMTTNCECHGTSLLSAEKDPLKYLSVDGAIDSRSGAELLKALNQTRMEGTSFRGCSKITPLSR